MLRLVNDTVAPTRRPLPRVTARSHPTAHPGTADPAAPTRSTRVPRPAPASPPAHADRPIAPTDPRWLFAARVAGAVEGGRAGIIRPENRDRLMRIARLLGLRAFDASLVIAMVQDTARRGEAIQGHPPLTQGLAERLTAVPEVTAAGRPPPPRLAVPILQRLAGAAIIAAAMVSAAILWLNGAGP
jgi:hypothetical protein